MLARVIFGFAASLVGTAALMRTWARAYPDSDFLTGPNHDTEGLVADGPYRHVRNPLYLGTILASLGMGFLLSRTGVVILLAGTLVRVLRLMGRVEDDFEKRNGGRYRELCRKVPRLLPSLRPRVPDGHHASHWGQAFRDEALTWGYFVTVLVFAITLRDRLVWILGGLALLVYLAFSIPWRRTVVAVR